MRKKIGRRIYDTDKAEYVGRNAQGYYGDPTGFEELMYKKGPGDFFLFVSGGPESQYPNEDIIPIALSDAREWIERVRGGEVVAQFITEKDEAALEEQNKAAVSKAKKAPAKTEKSNKAEKAAPAKKAPAKKPAAKKTAAKKPAAKKTEKKA